MNYLFWAIWKAGTGMGHTDWHKPHIHRWGWTDTPSAVSVYNFHQHHTKVRSMPVAHSQEDNSLGVPQSLQPQAAPRKAWSKPVAKGEALSGRTPTRISHSVLQGSDVKEPSHPQQKGRTAEQQPPKSRDDSRSADNSPLRALWIYHIRPHLLPGLGNRWYREKKKYSRIFRT